MPVARSKFHSPLLGTVLAALLVFSPMAAVSVGATSSTPLTLDQLTSDLVAAQNLQQFPSSLNGELTNNLISKSYAGPCMDNKTANATVATTGCTFGTLASAETVVLYGDSQAAMWQPAFAWLGTNHNFKLVLVSRRNCPFASLPSSAYKDPNCRLWKINAVKYINSLSPSIVLFVEKNVGSVDSSAPTAVPAVFAKDLTTTINLVKATKKIFFTGMPYVHYDSRTNDLPGPCISVHYKNLRLCATPIGHGFVAARVTADAAGAQAAHATVISATPLICGPITCPVVLTNGATSYIDFSNEFHIPTWYSLLVANPLGELLVKDKVTGL